MPQVIFTQIYDTIIVMSALKKRGRRQSHKKNELITADDRRVFDSLLDRLPARLRRYLRNKYAVASTILLIAIIVLVMIALIPPVTAAESESGADDGTDVIYIIDEKGNKVAASPVEDDSIVMQNQKEAQDPVLLSYNPDTREGYMNNCIFLGDSRTVAMVSYGVISDSNALAKVGIAHWQVLSTTFVQNSGARFTLSDYLRAHNEKVIYVCYGVNGMNGLDEEKYKKTYTELVDKIISLAGDRHVVLMSIWPVDDNGRYKGSVKNEWVNKYNEFLYNMAKEKGLHYLDVSSILKDDSGNIKKEYDSGDGLHYRATAYNDILDYIIHHPVPGVSDEGEFVVHYVKPRGEYKDIMTETPTLPQNIQIEEGLLPTDPFSGVPEVPEGSQPEEGTVPEEEDPYKDSGENGEDEGEGEGDGEGEGESEEEQKRREEEERHEEEEEDPYADE